jgi:branched-chain amino acid transport system permease protein
VNVVQGIVSGGLIGGLYALMAVGLSVTWGILRVINVMHFALILIAGYLTLQFTESWGWDPLVTMLVSVPILFAVGAAIQFAYDVFKLQEFNSLLVSFGLLIVVIQAATLIWTADFRSLPSEHNAYATDAIHLGTVVLPFTTLIAFVLAVALIAGAHMLLIRTFLGRAMRAFSQDRPVAAAFGIRDRRLALIVAGGAGASAAVAGAIFMLGNHVAPTVPYSWFGIVFAVVILGGIGNLLGTLWAGIGIGVLSGVVATVWSPSAEPLVLFLAIALALVLRPQGLFTRSRVA